MTILCQVAELGLKSWNYKVTRFQSIRFFRSVYGILKYEFHWLVETLPRIQCIFNATGDAVHFGNTRKRTGFFSLKGGERVLKLIVQQAKGSHVLMEA